jgi:flagellar protein FlaF
LNALTHAYQNYASPSSIKSARDTEIEIILETTRRLKSAHQNRVKRYSAFADALQTNRKLWIVLATDVARAENALPSELKARIFYLNEFVQHQTRLVLRDDVAIEPLLDVNLAILRGLGTRGAA